MIINRTHFGIDGYNGDSVKLNSCENVRRFLKRLNNCFNSDLEPACKIIEHKAELDVDSGVSGLYLVCGGHITVHTYPHRGIVYFDFLALKDKVDSSILASITDAIEYFFGVKKIEVYDISGCVETEVKESSGDVYGYHQVIDISMVDKVLDVEKMLLDVVDITEMNMILEPQLVYGEENQISAVLMIAESHISLHWDAEGSVYIDVFSCKVFDLEAVILYFSEQYVNGVFDCGVVVRGKWHY